jgi:hypothetical protein
MKMLSFVIIVGFILLYFLNIALLKTPDINWFTHSWLRFLVGFLILGVLSFYAHAITFKKAIVITLLIDLANYFYDYSTSTYRMQLEIILYGIFMLSWGSLVGYLTAKWLKDRIENNKNTT